MAVWSVNKTRFCSAVHSLVKKKKKKISLTHFVIPNQQIAWRCKMYLPQFHSESQTYFNLFSQDLQVNHDVGISPCSIREKRPEMIPTISTLSCAEYSCFYEVIRTFVCFLSFALENVGFFINSKSELVYHVRIPFNISKIYSFNPWLGFAELQKNLKNQHDLKKEFCPKYV